LLEKIHGFKYNPVNGTYELDERKNFCFNTTNLTKMGVVFWEEDEDWVQINWYMTVAKCNNST